MVTKMIEIKFTGQSKATTCQVKLSPPYDEEENNKALLEAKRVYADGLKVAKVFTQSQQR